MDTTKIDEGPDLPKKKSSTEVRIATTFCFRTVWNETTLYYVGTCTISSRKTAASTSLGRCCEWLDVKTNSHCNADILPDQEMLIIRARMSAGEVIQNEASLYHVCI